MYTHIQTILKRPFIRQIAGGLAGSVIALVLYSVYDMASGALHAMLVPNDSVITDDMRVQKTADVAARAREALEELH